MLAIDPAQRRALRAKAHHLHPVVSVGQHGLTPRVLHEIDLALAAHGLVKVRVHSDDRGDRETMLARIADELDSAPVQHLGKLLILWRPPEEPEPAQKPVKRAAKAARTPGGARSRTAKAAPRARERQRGEDQRSTPAGRRAHGAAVPVSKPAASEFGPASRRRRIAGTSTTAGKAPKTTDAATSASRGRAFGGAGQSGPREPSARSAPNPRRRRAR